MSDSQPPPADPGTPAQGASRPSDPAPTKPDSKPDKAGGKSGSTASKSGKGGGDPLRGSRTSGVWVAVVLSIVILVLLIIFIAQNTDPVSVRFLGWEGATPLAVALLVATVAGLFLAAAAGSMRILQLRRRVRRDSR